MVYLNNLSLDTFVYSKQTCHDRLIELLRLTTKDDLCGLKKINTQYVPALLEFMLNFQFKNYFPLNQGITLPVRNKSLNNVVYSNI